jgi:hypothetical protein
MSAGELRSAIDILRKNGFSRLTKDVFKYLFSERYPETLVKRETFVEDGELYGEVADASFGYTEPEEVTITGAACGRELPEELRRFYGRYSEDGLCVYEVPNATLTKNGTAFTDGGRPIFNTLGGSEYLYRHSLEYNWDPLSTRLIFSTTPLFSSLHEPLATVETGFNLVRRGSYYHWLTESLPNVRALRTYERRAGVSELPVVIENDPPDWVTESLSLLDVDNVIEFPVDPTHEFPSDPIQVETLVSAPRRNRDWHNLSLSTRDLEWVRDQYTSKTPDVERSDNRILISRADADSRRIRNRRRLEERLEPLGFSSYVLSELDFSEQITLFENAEVVLGVHGAGLANVLFSDDLKLLEIRPSSKTRWHDFYVMAEQLGFSYEYHEVVCQEGEDLVVDVDELEDTVERLLAE